MAVLPAPDRSLDEARQRVAELRATLVHHERLYYVEDRLDISAAEFDGPMRELQALERQHPSFVAPDSPTQREGERLERESKRPTTPRRCSARKTHSMKASCGISTVGAWSDSERTRSNMWGN